MASDDNLDDLDAGLARLVGDTRAADAARSRMRERTLRDAAGADATLAGILLDFAEAEARVAARTVFGRTVHGRVAVVASDAVVIESEAGLPTYLRLDGVAWVRRQPGSAPRADVSGDRPPPRTATFSALVGALAGERPRVALAVLGEAALLSGELRAAGSDVLTLRLDGDPPVTVYVALAQVSEVTVLASG
jgi:hypothetical protein